MNDQILDDDLEYKQEHDLDRKTVAWINSIKASSNKRIKNVMLARNLLFVMGALLVLMGLLGFSFNDRLVVGSIEGILKMIVYVLCGMGVLKYSAKYSILAGLSFFVLVQIYHISMDMSSLWSWIVFKVLIVLLLIQGFSAARDLERDAIDLLKLGASEKNISLLKKMKKMTLTK